MICKNNLKDFQKAVAQLTKKEEIARIQSLRLTEAQSIIIQNLKTQLLHKTQSIDRLHQDMDRDSQESRLLKDQLREMTHKVSRIQRQKEELEFKLEREAKINVLRAKQVEEVVGEMMEAERKHKHQLMELQHQLMLAMFPFCRELGSSMDKSAIEDEETRLSYNLHNYIYESGDTYKN